MGAAANRETHVRWYEAEVARDLSRHRDFCHEDMVVECHPGPTYFNGLGEYVASVEAIYVAFGDLEMSVEDRIATDDRVVCRWRASGVHRADLPGLPATGGPIEQSGISLWEFVDGRAARGWIYLDTKAGD